jgi:hypothetical protein
MLTTSIQSDSVHQRFPQYLELRPAQRVFIDAAVDLGVMNSDQMATWDPFLIGEFVSIREQVMLIAVLDPSLDRWVYDRLLMLWNDTDDEAEYLLRTTGEG